MAQMFIISNCQTQESDPEGHTVSAESLTVESHLIFAAVLGVRGDRHCCFPCVWYEGRGAVAQKCWGSPAHSVTVVEPRPAAGALRYGQRLLFLDPIVGAGLKKASPALGVTPEDQESECQRAASFPSTSLPGG